MTDYCVGGTPKLRDQMQGSLDSVEVNIRYTLDELQTTMKLASPVEDIVARQISGKLNEAYSLVLQLRSARNAQCANGTTHVG